MTSERAGRGGFLRRERRWRRAAAILLAPAVIAPIDLLARTNYMAAHPEKALLELAWYTEMSYIGSLIAAAVVGLIMRMRGWPPRALTILVLFPLVCGGISAAFALFVALAYPAPGKPLDLWGAAIGIVTAIGALPVALAYCFIAGVPWRARRAA